MMASHTTMKLFIRFLNKVFKHIYVVFGSSAQLCFVPARLLDFFDGIPLSKKISGSQALSLGCRFQLPETRKNLN